MDANAEVGDLEVGTMGVQCYENTLNDFLDVAVWDTPGFFDVEGRTPAGVLREMAANIDDFHVVLYAQPSTDRRMRLEDEQSITFLLQALGVEVASRTVVALTFANELADAEREKVIGVKGEQVGGLFDAAAVQLRGRSAGGSLVIPSLAIGERGGGWESAVWTALVRCAAAAPNGGSTMPFEVDWNGLAGGYRTKFILPLSDVAPASGHERRPVLLSPQLVIESMNNTHK